MYVYDLHTWVRELLKIEALRTALSSENSPTLISPYLQGPNYMNNNIFCCTLKHFNIERNNPEAT